MNEDEFRKQLLEQMVGLGTRVALANPAPQIAQVAVVLGALTEEVKKINEALERIFEKLPKT
jgi:Ni,Fe-hydrogenase III small subunit